MHVYIWAHHLYRYVYAWFMHVIQYNRDTPVSIIAGVSPSVNTSDSLTTSCPGTNVSARYILWYLATTLLDGSKTAHELYIFWVWPSLSGIEPITVATHKQAQSVAISL